VKKARIATSSVPNATVGLSDSSDSGSRSEQRDAQQRAHGVTDQPGHEPHADRVLEEQERGSQQQSAEAAHDGQADGDQEHRHGRIVSNASSQQSVASSQQQLDTLRSGLPFY